MWSGTQLIWLLALTIWALIFSTLTNQLEMAR